MDELTFELNSGQTGILDDGRQFCILSIYRIVLDTDGSLKYGDIIVSIDGKTYIKEISDFIQHIKSINSIELK